jgi:hypothetical protein
LFDKSPDLDVSLARLTEDPNIRIALKELRGVGDTAFASWRWLTGQPLKGTELNNLQLTRNLGELGASDLVSALVATGNLADHVNEKLIFLIDEMEELQNVRTGDAADSIHQYFRRLAEPANSTVGFIVGFKADVPDEAPLMLRKEDVRGRIGPSNYVDLRSLSVIPDVKAFVGELLKNLTDETRTTARVSGQKLSSSFGIFPFSESALDLLAAHATGDPTKAFPRYIINTINECAIQAWDEKKALIDDSIVNIVAGYAFG